MHRRGQKSISAASTMDAISDPSLCDSQLTQMAGRGNPPKQFCGQEHQKPTRTLSLASSEIYIPRVKKDLFRAFLGIRPHDADKESNEHYARIEKVKHSNKTCEHGELERSSSSSEFFIAGYDGKYERRGLLKFKNDGERNIKVGGSADNLKNDDVARCLTPGPFGETKIFCSGKAKSCIKVNCDETKSSWNGPYFDVPEILQKPTKKYFSNNLNTYDNIFGGRFESNTTTNNNEVLSVASSESDFRATGSDTLSQCEGQEPKDKLYRVITGPTRCSAWLLENECSRRVLGLNSDDLNDKMETMFRPQKKQFLKHSSTSMNLSFCDYNPLESQKKPSDETLPLQTMESLIPEELIPDGFPDDIEVPKLKRFASSNGNRTKSETLRYTETMNGNENKSDARLNILVTSDQVKTSSQGAARKMSPESVKRSECTWFRDTNGCSGDKIVNWRECRFNFKLPS